MNVWIRMIVWAALVGLQFYVERAFLVKLYSMRRVDPEGPIWRFEVREPDIWVHSLLLLSLVVLMPLGNALIGKAEKARWRWIEGISACLVGLSLLVSPVDPRVMFASSRIVPLGFLCSMPWLLVRTRVAATVLFEWIRGGMPGHAKLCMQSAQVFAAIGAAWLVANRAHWTPWRFDPLIVLLTATHFHHAGFTLPLMAGLNAKAKPNWLTKSSCIAILAGVPLVAVGITCTHVGVLPFMEPLGVAVLVAGAFGVAVIQMMRGIEFRSGLGCWTRAGYIVSGATLFVAMFFALGFGLRYVFPNLTLTMPQMWMIHGTLNAFGFGLCGILAWRGMSR